MLKQHLFSYLLTVRKERMDQRKKKNNIQMLNSSQWRLVLRQEFALVEEFIKKKKKNYHRGI